MPPLCSYERQMAVLRCFEPLRADHAVQASTDQLDNARGAEEAVVTCDQRLVA